MAKTRTRRSAPPLTSQDLDPLANSVSARSRSLGLRASQSQIDAARLAITHTHRRYNEWLPVWEALSHVYEGDGPYLTGDALIPHARELNYGLNPDGTTNFDLVVSEKRKFQDRKRLARYENFAATLVDLFTDYQYAKEIARSAETGVLDKAPITDFWNDCDGRGTLIGDWFEQTQTLVNVFGHVFVVMDRTGPRVRGTNITPEGGKTQPTSLADLGRPVLRVYTPLQTPDWIWDGREDLQAVKFCEAVERISLFETQVVNEVQYFVWDNQEWAQYNHHGIIIARKKHGFGRLPVKVWQAKPRGSIPVIGRSLLRDASLFRDHYNLISELRELFRSQTFSMLNIQLGENDTIAMARERLGDHAGTDALVFTKGSAQFIAPADGPASLYIQHLADVERKAFRLVHLPWDNDSRDAEAAESRRLKAADLNAALCGLADRAQKIDQWAAKMAYIALYGAEAGEARFTAAKVRTNHPQDFNVTDMVEEATGVQTVLSLNVGPTATLLLKSRVITAALPDLPEDQIQTITDELKADSAKDQESRDASRDTLIAASKVPPGGEPGAAAPPSAPAE